MAGSAKTILESSLEALINDASRGKSKLGQIFRKVASHPLKMLAAFFTAPILLFRLILKTQNPTRRIIAVIGLVVGLLLAYATGTFLGTVAFALIAMSSFGILIGIGFLVGSTLSVIFSITFSIFIFHLISYLFLKMNTEEVLEYLKELSGGN